MSKKQTPFRYDIVGSFLRPAKLKEARKQFEEGQLDAKGLKQVEDEAITDLIEKIKAAGYHTLTDGEFRRATWHLDFMWACDGIAHKPTKTGLPFHGEQAMIDDTYLVGKIALTNEHPFVEHFRFVQSFEDENTVAKQTIPAPAQFLAQFIMPFNDAETKKYYSDRNALIDDIVAVYQKTIDQLYEAGCRNLQLDDCTWGMLVDETAPSFFNTDAEGLKAYQILFKDINNAVIDYAPKDFVTRIFAAATITPPMPAKAPMMRLQMWYSEKKMPMLTSWNTMMHAPEALHHLPNLREKRKSFWALLRRKIRSWRIRTKSSAVFAKQRILFRWNACT